VELGVKLVDTETRRLVGVERQHVGRHVDLTTATDYDEVATTWSTFAVWLHVVTDVDRRDVGTQLQHPHVNCRSHTVSVLAHVLSILRCSNPIFKSLSSSAKTYKSKNKSTTALIG